MAYDPRLREPWQSGSRRQQSGFLTALVIKLTGGRLDEAGAAKTMTFLVVIFFLLTIILLYRALAGESVKPLPAPQVPTETLRNI